MFTAFKDLGGSHWIVRNLQKILRKGPDNFRLTFILAHLFKTMLIDLQKFITEERPFWSELEGVLDRLEKRPELRLSLAQLERFHYLYQRASADLAKIKTFSAEPNTRTYLESMVARAFGEIHETRRKPHRLRPFFWFFTIFPRAFRRHLLAFWISTAAMLLGVERPSLIGSQFNRFIMNEYQDIFYLHQRHILEKMRPNTCELKLISEKPAHLMHNWIVYLSKMAR